MSAKQGTGCNGCAPLCRGYFTCGTSKMTPGPWRVWKDMDVREPLQILGMDTDFICEVSMINTNAAANARAIAAVPDLIAALGAALYALEQDSTILRESDSLCAEDIERDDSAIKSAREALRAAGAL